MKKEYRIAFRSVLELVALGGIKVDTALRRISGIIETIEAGKAIKTKTSYDVDLQSAIWSRGLGRCTWGSVPLNN